MTQQTIISPRWFRDAYADNVPDTIIQKTNAASRLLWGFEGLGVNCRFGFVQRDYGVESLHLLRWAGQTIDSLLNGIRCGWKNIDNIDGMRLEYRKDLGHFLVIINSLGLIMHTEEVDPAADHAALAHKAARRHAFLARKMLEDMAAAQKLYLYNINQAKLDRGKIDELLNLLLTSNPNNKLLVVQRAGGAEQGTEAEPGSIVQLSDSLVVGHIREEDAAFVDGLIYGDWLSVCRQTKSLWHPIEAQT